MGRIGGCWELSVCCGGTEAGDPPPRRYDIISAKVVEISPTEETRVSRRRSWVERVASMELRRFRPVWQSRCELCVI